MSHHITLELPDQVYEDLASMASQRGKTPEEAAVEELCRAVPHQGYCSSQPDSLGQLLKHAGAVNLGQPTGTDNESIDRDLARAYGNGH